MNEFVRDNRKVSVTMEADCVLVEEPLSLIHPFPITLYSSGKVAKIHLENLFGVRISQFIFLLG